MEGHSTRLRTQRPLVMNHHDPERYSNLHSPLSPKHAGLVDSLPQLRHNGMDDYVSLVSNRFNEHRLSDIPSDLRPPTRWYRNFPETNCDVSGQIKCSSLLSLKTTQPTMTLAYRPPTPTHRGILKGNRPPLDVNTDSSQSEIPLTGFWDGVDLSSEVNDSCNSIASYNVTDSLSRKTVRFAEGKPTVSNRAGQLPCDSIRGTTSRSSCPVPQGIYEWEMEEGSVMGDFSKPPRPPKLRPIQRYEQRIPTDCIDLPSAIRCAPMGTLSPPPTGSTSLRNRKSAATKVVDGSYVNFESIYHSGGHRYTNCAKMDRLEIQHLHALMQPYMTSPSPECSPLTSSPPSTSCKGSIYRTEVKINESAFTTSPLQSESSLSPQPLHFKETFDSLSIRRDNDRSSIDNATTKSPLTIRSDSGFNCSPISPLGNGNEGRVAPRPQNNHNHQMPAQTQREQRYLPLLVDGSQSKMLKHPPLPLLGSPFHHGFVELSQPVTPTNLKTGSLDRDGIWRPASGCPLEGSTSLVSRGPAYLPSSLLPRRRSLRYSSRSFPTFSNGIGVSGGGYEVPIYVVPSATNSATTPTPIPLSSPLSPSSAKPSK